MQFDQFLIWLDQKRLENHEIYLKDLLSNPFSALIAHLLCNNLTPLVKTENNVGYNTLAEKKSSHNGRGFCKELR